MLTQERLRAVLSYDEMTGVFRRLVRCSNAHAGKVAGTRSPLGYLQIMVDGVLYQAHRLAWLYVYGHWPHGDIDHANMMRADNRIANLRDATRSQNLFNTTVRKDSRSGIKGVKFHKKSQRWIAVIKVSNKSQHLGSFDTAEQAAIARANAARQLHGEFARVQ